MASRPLRNRSQRPLPLVPAVGDDDDDVTTEEAAAAAVEGTMVEGLLNIFVLIIITFPESSL
jgi:hypothetical protein